MAGANSTLIGSTPSKAGTKIFCGQFLGNQINLSRRHFQEKKNTSFSVGRTHIIVASFSKDEDSSSTLRNNKEEDTKNASLQQLAVGFLGGILSASFIFTNPASLDFLPPPALASTRLTSDETSAIRLFNRNTPSVVFITNLATRKDAFTLNNLEVPQGAGSGFVWDSKGHIVTNYHVIRGASEVRVTLSGGSDYAATVVGVDEDRDVAVLKIDTSTTTSTKGKDIKKDIQQIDTTKSKDAIETQQLLTPLQLGTSSDLQVGQRVYAIGNPFGLDHTLTTGVISGVQREISSGTTGRPIEGIIQTDAAINPGNSGGPLLDSSGSVIGINTAIFSPSGANAGVGFAIPIDLVKSSAEQIIQFGRVVRPIMGISFAPDAAVEQLGVTGVLVLNARDGGPAAKAGVHGTTRDEYGRLVLGDIILSVDGKKVKTASDLYRALDKANIGDSLDVELLRGDKTVHAAIVLEPSTAPALQPLPIVIGGEGLDRGIEP